MTYPPEWFDPSTYVGGIVKLRLTATDYNG